MRARKPERRGGPRLDEATKLPFAVRQQQGGEIVGLPRSSDCVMKRTKLDANTRASKFVTIPGSKSIFCVALVLELCTATPLVFSPQGVTPIDLFWAYPESRRLARRAHAHP